MLRIVPNDWRALASFAMMWDVTFFLAYAYHKLQPPPHSARMGCNVYHVASVSIKNLFHRAFVFTYARSTIQTRAF